MNEKTVSLTMTVRELGAVAFACLREHAKLGLLRRSQPELKGLEEAYALYSGLLSEMLALQKEFSDVDEEGAESGCYRDWETDRKSTRLNSSH